MFCPECGIRNSEGASFCVRCGASLIADQPESATTLSYVPGDEEGEPNALAAIAGDEACLVIRSGGGRAGETYPLRGARVAIGRHPDAAIFLDLSLIHISEPTRLGMISYAVFCLKKKKKQRHNQHNKHI